MRFWMSPYNHFCEVFYRISRGCSILRHISQKFSAASFSFYSRVQKLTTPFPDFPIGMTLNRVGLRSGDALDLYSEEAGSCLPWLRILWFSPVSPGQCKDSSLKYTTTVSFKILNYSYFITSAAEMVIYITKNLIRGNENSFIFSYVFIWIGQQIIWRQT